MQLRFSFFFAILLLFQWTPAPAQAPVRGSIIEDRAARKLLEAGDARLDANETEKALEIWQSVIERYPRSKVRFDAHMRLGTHYLTRQNAYDQARSHFETAADESNANLEQRATATLNMGICFYEGRHFGTCFKTMRQVIEEFPTSSEVNRAYYYIGMGHFKQGHYSRAIEALEKVGTSLTADDQQVEKVEAGRRLFVRIEDADLAILDLDETVDVKCTTRNKDVEILSCRPVGRNVRVVLGSMSTRLGKPVPGNGTLEVRGGDVVKVEYVDAHTADRQFNRPRLKDVVIVGNAMVQIMDGAYQDDLKGVVLGKEANLQVIDADFDVSDKADSLKAHVDVFREKTNDEIETELAEKIASGELQPTEDGSLEDENGQPIIDRWKRVDEVSLTFEEWDPPKEKKKSTPEDAVPGDVPEAPESIGEAARKTGDASVDNFLAEVESDVVDDSIHSGIFRTTIPLVQAEEAVPGDRILQALPGDKIRLSIEDKLHRGSDPITVKVEARCIEGMLGGVRVTQTDITDEELRLKTQLRTASALCNIGNHYKEFGLDDKAELKYQEALRYCEEISNDARQLGGKLLEETYVQLWRIYFAMDELSLASAVSQRLQREFPNSSFVDQAILQQADIARKQGNLGNAINLYNSLLKLKNSSLRGEGQYGVAACYEQMATEATEGKSGPLFDRAFEEYKKVFTQFPESGRVGDAVAKMATFYYKKKDYARAIDVFESVLADHPDANFLDVILFNYGRCLYRLDRKREARRQFDQLINDFPESDLASEAKRISDALSKSGI